MTGKVQSRARFWQVFFGLACAFNCVIGAMGLFEPEATVDERIISVLVAGFGVLYLVVAIDPARFAPTIWAGLLGKVGVVVLLGPQAFGAGGDVMQAGVLAIDALFALGFLAFLLSNRET